MTPTRAGAARPDAPPGDSLDAVLSAEALHSVFQPLVRLDDGVLVGYEVLTRGPAGHRLEAPLDLIVEARRTGRLSDLDWAMVTSGLRAALALASDAPVTFFLNVESDNLSNPFPPEVVALLAQAQRRLTLVVEFTERDRKSTRLNSSHANISYAVFCLKKKNKNHNSWLMISSRN